MGLFSFLGDIFGGDEKEAEVKKTSTLNPEQERLFGALGPFLAERIGKGLPSFEGDFVAPLSDLETRGLESAREFVDSGTSPLFGATSTALQEGLEGFSPQESIDFFNEFILPERQRVFRERVKPAIDEEFVGRGSFFSTARATEQSRSRQAFEESNLSEIGDLIQSERAASRALIPQGLEAARFDEGAPLRRAEAGIAFGALPRGIEQAELVAKLEEFKRTTPELSPVIDRAIQALGITTQAAFFDEGQPNAFLEVLSAVSPGIGTFIGSRGKKTSEE